MKYIRTLPVLLLAALLALCLVLPAAATDLEEENQPIISDDGFILIKDGVSFDPKTREYVYPVGNSGTVVRATVADGMIVNSAVRIQGATLLIYKDGQLWEGDSTEIKEPGEYVVMAQTGNQTPRLFTFTVVGTATAEVYSYSVPSGMAVMAATRDGSEIDFERGNVPMQEDGLYHVEYTGLSTGAYYSLDLRVDRTPPKLQFSGNIDDHNRVHGPLTFSGMEEGDSIQVLLDGTQIAVDVKSDGTGELTQSGSYIIRVYDAAGNLSEYGYTILLYFNGGSLAFFALLLLSLVALVVYIVIKRRHLEIG